MSQNQMNNPADRPTDTPGQQNPGQKTPGQGQPGQQQPGRGNPAERPQQPDQGHPADTPRGNPADRPGKQQGNLGSDDNSLSDLRDEGDHRV